MTYILFAIGFIFLIRGAEWLIDGSSVIAKKLGVSDLLIGLTVVAFGTSLPELVVNLFASGESPELAIGNVVGSNIANILLILGIAAAIHPITVHRAIVTREVLFNIFAAGMLGILVSERLLSKGGFDGLDHIDGVVLISYFVIFLYITFGRKTHAQSAMGVTPPKRKLTKKQYFWAIGKVVAGSAGLFLGGKWIVDGAISIAELAGVSDAIIGLTIVAIGTSLPELAATITAVRRGKQDIAIGNILGSNIFNIFWVLGLSAFVSPLPFSDDLFLDVLFNFGIALMLWATLAIGKYKHQISRPEGYFFVTLYISYLIFLGVTSQIS